MRKLTDEEKELRKMARRLKKHCEKANCSECCFAKTNINNEFDFCQIGYGWNWIIPKRWAI